MVKSSPLRYKFFIFSSARVKIRQITHVNFGMTSQSPFKFCIILYCHDKYVIFSPVKFKLIHFLLWIKGSHQSFNAETYESSGENLPNSSCHFWKHKTAFLQVLHHYSVLSNITPLYFFSSNIIYFDQKQPIKVKIFEIFECSGQNLLSPSCLFCTDKSIPLQIFLHSSVSLHITPL